MLYPNGSTTRPRVSSPYGPRKGGVSSFHAGADLVGFSTIHAVASGRVTFAGWMNRAAGYTIVIDHGGGVSSVYMHNAAHYVERGARVAEGQPIAAMGASGNATGPCNHLEIRRYGRSTEPLGYIAARLTKPTPPTTPASTATTTNQEEHDMATIVAQRTNSTLPKGLYNPTTGRIREITRHENTLLRAAQEQHPEQIIYATVPDAAYEALLKGAK